MGLADATFVAAHELGHHISRVRSDPNVEPQENRQRNYLTGQSEPKKKAHAMTIVLMVKYKS